MQRVLIAEDSPTQAAQLQMILEDAGLDVVMAADGEQALELLEQVAVDLVISDIVMPGMSGYDLCRQIKLSPAHRSLPVILLSTLSEPMDIIHGLESGADNFLTKPYRPDQLVARVQAILQNRELRSKSATLGLEIVFLGKRFTITSEKEQILDLLISTFEDTVNANRELQSHRAELASAKIKLEEYAHALEGRVRLSEEKFRGFLTASPDVMIVVDDAGRIVLTSQRIETLFGYTSDELVGEPFDILMPARYREVHADHTRGFMRTPQIRDMGIGLDLRGLRKDGTEFPTEISLSPHQTPDGLVVIAAVRDITERKQLEEQLHHAQRLEAMGQLTGGLAHDFNNLLGVIIGNLDVIAMRNIAEIKAFAENALEAAARGATLIRQLLAFARRQPLQPEHIAISERLPMTVRLLQSSLGANVTVVHRIDPDTLPIEADLPQLEAAILNLAVNARDAMADGGTIVIECTNIVFDEAYAESNLDVKPGSYVMISVSDNGCGMTPEIAAKVFDPFFSTKGASGTGLGLSQVFGFAKQSGGNVKIYSEVGVGTTVRLYLRAAKDTVNADPSGPVSDQLDSYRGSERILLVDDNDGMREIAGSQLRSLGYDVTTATAAEALDVLRSSTPVDLLFTDVIMPDIDGRELALRARELRPTLKILFTSGFTQATIVTSIQHDFDGALLSKPYRHIELAKCLRAMLGVA